MKQEKTMPRGVAPVSRTGVHRKTKMYMQDSNRDCTHPNNKIFSSWKEILMKTTSDLRSKSPTLKMILNPSIQEPEKSLFLLP